VSRRVVITGIGVLSALGDSAQQVFDSIRQNQSAVRKIEAWQEVTGLKTKLAAPLALKPDLSEFSNKLLRSTGGVAQYALVATSKALSDAGLRTSPLLASGRVGVAYGSGFGGNSGWQEGAKFLNSRSARGISAGVYHKIMSHTCATHIAIGFGVQGRLLCTSTACTSGSQAIGFGFDNIRHGDQDIMICGGAEELSEAIAVMFDVLCACSQKNESPSLTPRPFDSNRDGMVLGEGACTLILEELEHARKRGCQILAEVVGFSTNCDAIHITNPNAESIRKCFSDALVMAKLDSNCINYVNAHATGTSLGDAAEAIASRQVYGSKIPVSSLKGHLGHTLGACGALETALSIEAIRQGWVPPTRNLENVDLDCLGLNHICGEGRDVDIQYLATNTVAFGGINTSIILKQMEA
jgi:3-oxoacyl-[acyl-carrier-protein] synthase II